MIGYTELPIEEIEQRWEINTLPCSDKELIKFLFDKFRHNMEDVYTAELQYFQKQLDQAADDKMIACQTEIRIMKNIIKELREKLSKIKEITQYD